VVLGDFNGDGSLDIATANDGTANSVSVLLNNGDGTFQAPKTYSAGSSPVQIVTADFNGDGIPDLAVANLDSSNVTILLGNGDGTFRSGDSFAVGKNPRSLAVGDFNGDGIPDLVIACTDGYQTHSADVWLGNGDGTFRLSERDGADTPISVTVGDFNNDGILDFVMGDSGYQVSRYQGRGDGTFLPRVNYAAGHRVFQVTNADFNKDGNLDVAIAGDTYGAVTILPGIGNGTFQSPITAVDGGAVWTEVGDFNKDGNPDLAVLNNDGDSIGLALGNGDFKFQTPHTYKIGPGPGAGATSLAVGDLTGDGYQDIVVADRKFDYVAVLRNIPDANHFDVSAPASTVAGTPFNLTVTALNPLGNKDANYTGKVHFSSSDGQAQLPSDYTFTTGDQGQHTFSVTLKTAGSQTVMVKDTVTSSIAGTATITVTPAAAAKLSVAGFPSPVTAGSVHTFTVTALDPYGNTATGYTGTIHFTSSDKKAVLEDDYTFQTSDNGKHVFGAVLKTAGTQSITATDKANSTITGTQTGIVVNPAAADHLSLTAPTSVESGTPFPLTVAAKDPFDNTVTTYKGTIHFASSDPQAALPADYTFTTSDGGTHTFTVTLNTPGQQTITATDIANGIGGSVVIQVFGPLFGPPVNYPVGGNATATAAVDVNGDGRVDVVASNIGSNTVSVFLGNGDGTFQNPTNYPVSPNPWGVVVTDLNGDGRPDIVTADSSSNAVSVLLGNGDGTFQAAKNFAVGKTPYDVRAGDFNGDGYVDLVTSNLADNSVSILLGNGDGTFRSAVSYSTGGGPQAAAVGDFNGDGIPDLVVANSYANTVSLLLGNGDGTFQAARNYDVGTNPLSVTVGDFNGDGNLDFAVQNGLSNTASVLLGNGDGTFRPRVSYPVGQSPWFVTTEDLDRDGTLDLVVANGLGGSLSVLRGNGDGTFQPAVNYATDNGPRWVAIGDFNGDGAPDLAVANYFSNDVSILLNLNTNASPHQAGMSSNRAGHSSGPVANRQRSQPAWADLTPALTDEASSPLPMPTSTLSASRDPSLVSVVVPDNPVFPDGFFAGIGAEVQREFPEKVASYHIPAIPGMANLVQTDERLEEETLLVQPWA
jgi:hypothetical protein